jgi:hypothetical protein
VTGTLIQHGHLSETGVASLIKFVFEQLVMTNSKEEERREPPQAFLSFLN